MRPDHPARRPGTSQKLPARHTSIGFLFQSSPGPKTGCYGLLFNVDALRGVLSSFNPHPARRPGATSSPVRRATGRSPMFQSSPGPKTGCCLPKRALCATANRSPFLNPHPARRPGATSPGPTALHHPTVSILTRPEDPGATTYDRQTDRSPFVRGVSILTPARRPGATKGRGHGQGTTNHRFQSSPGPKTGCYATNFLGWPAF